MKSYALFLLLLLSVFIYMALSLDAPTNKRSTHGGEDTQKISAQVCIEKTDLRTCRGDKCCLRVSKACALEFEARVLHSGAVSMPRSACAAVSVGKLRRVLAHTGQRCECTEKERMLRRRIQEYCLPRCFSK